MSRSYALDLRKRIALRVQNGHARRSTAEHFGVSPTYAMNLLHNVDQTESRDMTRQGRHPGHVRAKCDITIPELTAILLRETGVPVDPSSLSRQLRKSRFSYKKTLMASERELADIAERRRIWINERQPLKRLETARLFS